MVTRARFTADLVSTVNANTSSPANAIFISSGGDVTIANSITVGGNIPGFVQNSYVHATFAQNTSTINLFDDRLQVANAAAAYVTKAVHLTSNNALVNLINDRLQIANADATYVTKAVALSSNTALVGLINDRLQVANLTSELSTYWPSANAIAYINANAGASDMTVNTSIFVASGGETSFAIPVTSNTNLVEVVLNGYELTRSIDWTANSTHIKGIEALAAGDIVQVHEYKLHPANTLNRSAGGGGGGYSFQGSTSGYTSGGHSSPYNPTPGYDVIDKFSLSSDANATDVGNLTQGRCGVSGSSSTSSGYTTGGMAPGTPGASPYSNVIDKFPFSSDANATDVGDLTVDRTTLTGQSSSTNGYASGGVHGGRGGFYDVIEKFPFSADANGSDVGDLTIARYYVAGQSSSTNGYTTGGISSPYARTNIIDKFPFSSDANATDVGDLSVVRVCSAGQSSSTNGYSSGGELASNSFDKFPFSSDANATDVGDLTQPVVRQAAGQSSTSSGYVSGGYRDGGGGFPATLLVDIAKFPFSSDDNATDVGDLTVARSFSAGQQV